MPQTAASPTAADPSSLNPSCRAASRRRRRRAHATHQTPPEAAAAPETPAALRCCQLLLHQPRPTAFSACSTAAATCAASSLPRPGHLSRCWQVQPRALRCQTCGQQSYSAILPPAPQSLPHLQLCSCRALEAGQLPAVGCPRGLSAARGPTTAPGCQRGCPLTGRDWPRYQRYLPGLQLPPRGLRQRAGLLLRRRCASNPGSQGRGQSDWARACAWLPSRWPRQAQLLAAVRRCLLTTAPLSAAEHRRPGGGCHCQEPWRRRHAASHAAASWRAGS